MNSALAEKLRSLPRTPGVYFHKNASGEIIYVGKAAVLKTRVRQYFQSSRDMDPKTLALVAEIADTDWQGNRGEIDALFLESEMVKRYLPRYNILLRDDKSQLYVRIDMKEEWPSVQFTRNPGGDGAEYFGPFYNGYALRKALRYLRKTFPYYLKSPKPGERATLDAHIGLEPYGLTPDEYKAELRKLINYIKGNRIQLVNELERAMLEAAKQQEFEKASVLRNRLQNLQELRRRIMFGDKEFLDISKDRALTQLRDILGLEESAKRIECFDISHTGGTNVVASQVVFTNGVSNRAEYRKYKVTERNDDTANMYEVVFRRLSPTNVARWGLPSLIIVDGGKGQLDAAIRASSERGYTLPIIGIAKREEELLVDPVRSGVQTTQLVAWMKQPTDSVYVVHDGVYLRVNLHPDQRNAGSHSKNLRGGTLSRYSDVIKLFQRIRDESHRFAIAYHATIRTKAQKKTVFDDIPGVGPATKRALLRSFGSLKGVKAASREDLAAVIGAARAERVYSFLASEISPNA